MTAPADPAGLPADEDDDPLDAAMRAAYASPAKGDAPGRSPSNPPSVLGMLRERTGQAFGEPTATGAGVPAAAGPGLERYRMLDELGRGGVGVVCRGRDVDLGRDVAMKLLHAGGERDADLLQRFVEEAQIGGQLQHPGIVPIYELGLQGGERPFIAMKLVEGETLAAQLQARSSCADDRHHFVGVFERVCEAVAYAHARDVIHRDLKPANVMLGAFGEVMVLDWGFAKVLGRTAAATAPREPVATRRSADDSAHSVHGSVMGTPAYMPPEQALGQVDRLDARADVFSLGAVLCEILTGRPAYPGTSAEAMRRAAAADLADAHRALTTSDAEPALVQLAIACLQGDPAQRPASAGELVERLRSHRGAVEERARRAELQAVQARVQARATKVVAATIGLSLVLGVGAWLAVRSAAEARGTEVALRVSGALQSARELFGQADGHRDVGRWDLAVAAAEQAGALAASPDAAPAMRTQVQQLDELARRRRSEAQVADATRRRDAAMLETLAALRAPADEDVARPGWERREAGRLETDYAAAFAAWGQTPAALTRDLAPALTAAIRTELAVALDHWATARQVLARHGAPPTVGSASELRALSAALDPDDAWRRRLRALLATEPLALPLLRDLANEPQLVEQPPLGIFLLGDALLKAEATEVAIATFERGVQRYPGEFLLAFWLGIARQRLPNPDTGAALDALRLARALRPDMAEVSHRIGIVYEWRGDSARALALFEELARTQPADAHWQEHLGRSLVRLGRVAEGVAAHQRAVALRPTAPSCQVALGTSWLASGDLAAATACFERAIELAPTYAPAHFELGLVLADRDEPAAALASLRRAFALSGALEHLWSVAKVQQNTGDLAGAVATFRQTIERDPRFAEGHFGLGRALGELGDLPGAIASQRAAVALMPRRAKYHLELGAALLRAGDLAAAEPALREAIALQPDLAEAYAQLGGLLLARGRAKEACEILRRCDELGRSRANWRHPSAQWLAEAEAMVAQQAELVAVARGERKAASAAEAIEAAAHVAQAGAWSLAAHAYGEAFAAHPELLADAGTGHALAAARVALQAAQEEWSHVDERDARRGEALRWLRQALVAFTGQLAAGGESAAQVDGALQSWGDAPELAMVRDPGGLAALPKSRAAAWQAFWSEVAAIRAKR